MKSLDHINDHRRSRMSALSDAYGQNELSRITGEATAMIYQMSKGKGKSRRNVSDEKAREMERSAGLPKGWFDDDSPVPPLKVPAPVAQLKPAAKDSEWDDILGYAVAAGLGGGIEAQEYAETHALKFRAASLKRKRLDSSTLAVIYGKGDSMLPRIRTGDAILFDMSDTKPADETLFVIHCSGANNSEYSVKRCRQFGDDIYFDSLNPDGDHAWRKPRKMMDRKNPITIAGRVRWIGSWED